MKKCFLHRWQCHHIFAIRQDFRIGRAASPVTSCCRKPKKDSMKTMMRFLNRIDLPGIPLIGHSRIFQGWVRCLRSYLHYSLSLSLSRFLLARARVRNLWLRSDTCKCRCALSLTFILSFPPIPLLWLNTSKETRLHIFDIHFGTICYQIFNDVSGFTLHTHANVHEVSYIEISRKILFNSVNIHVSKYWHRYRVKLADVLMLCVRARNLNRDKSEFLPYSSVATHCACWISLYL